MLQPQASPRRIAVIYPPGLSQAAAEGGRVAAFLREAGLDEVIESPFTDAEMRARVQGGEIDLVVALGGDGTMLRAGHLCAEPKVPILGINLGRFGFLAELRRDEWVKVLPLLLEKQFWLEERMMLRAEHHSRGALIGAWDVLNEVVVTRGPVVRPIRVRVIVDGHPLANYVADGLIAATPTGSTAYALAAGGPIMPPELRNILIIPVAPHLSVDRGVILPEGACVVMAAFSDHQSVFSIDGQSAVDMENGDEVHVQAGDHSVHFVRFQDPGYFYRNLTSYMEQNPSANGVKSD